MPISFNIVEQKTIPYDTLKEAYLSGIRGKQLREKFGLGTSQYARLLRDFREDGITVPHRGRTSINEETKWYSCEGTGNYRYWVVRRVIRGERHYFGRFKTEAEAQKCVQDCKDNDWYGLLK